ncbi:hypothetical protein E2C01_054182 [Portunus trituberculatus]|uniref:Uncharacterized protein n=1 Tax=Portunus trituberculatus TaxID=210409 RepID=A0A5B7GUB7_PORTR|nr:hypothetical protein [Portunus trituberculatus]
MRGHTSPGVRQRGGRRKASGSAPTGQRGEEEVIRRHYYATPSRPPPLGAHTSPSHTMPAAAPSHLP